LDWLLKLARCPHSLAATSSLYVDHSVAAATSRQLPSCVAVYPCDARSRRVLSRWSLSSIPDLWQQEAIRALQQGKDQLASMCVLLAMKLRGSYNW